jgi:hypothetical protein
MATTTTAAPPNPIQFLIALLTAIRQVTGGRGAGTWAKVDKVQQKLGTTNRDAIDAAIRLAVKKNLMRADGDPPGSISLTVDGVKLTEANRPAPPPAEGAPPEKPAA